MQTALKNVTCDPECGFSVTSHDTAELVGMVKTHAKEQHDMDFSTADVEEMIQDA